MNEAVLANLKPLVDHLGDKKFLEGDTVFLPDFLLFEFVEYAQAVNGGVTFQTYPTLEAFCNNVKGLPGMREFYNSDRAVKAPYLPPISKVKFGGD